MTANTTPRTDALRSKLKAISADANRRAAEYFGLCLALESELAAIRAETREECARVCEKRAETRWQEHGFTEGDTNASYYPGKSGDWHQAQDEEDENCAAAIRALPDAKGQTKAAHIVQTMDANGKWPSENQPMTVTTTAGTASGREEPKHWKVFCALCKSEWSVPYQHPGKSICEDCENKHNYLAAELERVKGERDEGIRALCFDLLKVSDALGLGCGEPEHPVDAEKILQNITLLHQRATTAEASATLHRDACMDYAQKLADAEAAIAAPIARSRDE